jgi:hypothetical protein
MHDRDTTDIVYMEKRLNEVANRLSALFVSRKVLDGATYTAYET